MTPRWLVFALVLGLSGCFSSPVILGPTIPFGYTPLGIEDGETIAVVLKSNTGPDGPLPRNWHTQKVIEGCINEGLRKEKSRLVLSDMNHPRLRFRIDLEVYTRLGDGQFGRQTPSPSPAVFATVRHRHTSFEGEVHDVKRNESMGRIVATADGKQESGVVFAYQIIPIPASASAPTEAEACEYFGVLLARRFTTEPAPVGVVRPARSEEPPRSEDLVNCVAGGERKWTYRSKCD